MKYVLLVLFFLPILFFQNCAERSFSAMPQESFGIEPLAPLPEPPQIEDISQSEIEAIPQAEADLASSPEDCLIQGQGTVESPYILDEECQLPSVPQVMTGEWVLNKDLDFTSTASEGLDRTYVFKVLSAGNFDGRNHRIAFTLDCKDNEACMSNYTKNGGVNIFSYVSKNARLKNVSLHLTVKNLQFPYATRVKNIASVGSASNAYFSRVQSKLNLHGTMGHNTHGLNGVASLLGSGFYNEFDQIDGSLDVDGHFSPYAVGVIGGVFCESTISNSLAKGDVDGGYFTGGLTGGCGNGGGLKVQVYDSWYEGNLSHRTPLNGSYAWPGCKMMSPFGSAQGIAPGENSRTQITNSYWVGISEQCLAGLPYVPLASRAALSSQLSAWDTNIWTIKNGESPKLKWVLNLE